MNDLRQTKEYGNYMRLLGWNVEKIGKANVYIRKVPILGSIMKLQRFRRHVPLEKLNFLQKKYRVFEILLEPLDEKTANFYLENKFHFGPPSLATKTIIIDLQNSQNNLLANMHHKTRYNIKQAVKKKVVINKSDDIESFSMLWHKSAKKRGMYLSLKSEIVAIYKSFENRAQIYFSFVDKELVGGLLTVASSDTVYYMYAATSEIGKKVFAPTLLVWSALENARKEGYKYFDFEGIYDERFPIKNWKGFTRFKKSFGGKEITYPGTLRRRFIPI